MNVDEIFNTLDGANEEDLIRIFVFRNPIEFCKQRFDFDVCNETKTLCLISKNGKSLKVMNTNSIRLIEIESPRKPIDIIMPEQKIKTI